MVIWARMPLPRAAAAISSQAFTASSTLQPWLRWLKLSLARNRHADLGASGGTCALETLEIQHQTNEASTSHGRAQGREHILGVRHLWVPASN